MELVKEFFPKMPAEVLAKLEQFCMMLREKNEWVNLISRKDIDQIIPCHLLPSLAICKICPFGAGDSVLDIGTGGGFPGIPLAIVHPHTRFTLVDSIGKKIKAVEQFAKDLGLKNVTCKNMRVENLQGKFNYVVGRAVMPWGDFLRLSQTKLVPGGKVLYLTGGDVSSRLKMLKINDIGELYEQRYCKTKILMELQC